MKGIIVSSICGAYKVLIKGQEYNVTARGLFKHHKRKLIVGDYVEIDEKENMITNYYEQTNSFIRPSIANVDQAAVVMSAVEPEFSLFLVDKFLTYINFNNVNGIVIITKVDKLNNRDEIDKYKRIIESYGVKVIYFSKVTKEGASSLIEVFSNKTTVLMGQSGVGKSSLLNALIPEYNRLIGEYSSALGRGKHQTKEVVLLPFYNGFIADTPGFSSLDIELTPKQIAMSFPVIKEYYGTCFFADCLHISEKGCKVKERIDNGFSSLSYENYLVLIKEAKERKAKY